MVVGYQPLPNNVVLDVLITRRDDPRGSDPYCALAYQLWHPQRGKHYEQLYFDPEHDLWLHPGVHAQVSGRHEYVISEKLPPSLVIDEVTGPPEFVLAEGQTISLVDPMEGRIPNTTYANWIMAYVNAHNRDLKLHVQTTAFGRVVKGKNMRPSVRITRVDPPIDKRGYYLYAQFG